MANTYRSTPISRLTMSGRSIKMNKIDDRPSGRAGHRRRRRAVSGRSRRSVPASSCSHSPSGFQFWRRCRVAHTRRPVAAASRGPSVRSGATGSAVWPCSRCGWQVCAARCCSSHRSPPARSRSVRLPPSAPRIAPPPGRAGMSSAILLLLIAVPAIVGRPSRTSPSHAAKGAPIAPTSLPTT